MAKQIVKPKPQLPKEVEQSIMTFFGGMLAGYIMANKIKIDKTASGLKLPVITGSQTKRKKTRKKK